METPAAQNIELGFSGLAGDFDQVGFFHAGSGAGKAVGQFAVVGDHEQAFAHVVQAADGIEALAILSKNCITVGRPSGSLTVVTKPLGLLRTK